MLLEPLEERLLDFEILDNGLDDPIRVRGALEIVFEVPDTHELRPRRDEECGRLRFHRGVEPEASEPVAHRPVGEREPGP